MADPRPPADDVQSSTSLDYYRDRPSSILAEKPATSPPPTASASATDDNASTAPTAAENAHDGEAAHDAGDGAHSHKSPTGNPVPPPAGAEPNPELLKHVNGVLTSEIGIATLLNRLKQSIASAKEFAQFLKKRATLEEDNAQGLKKLCRSTQDSMRRPDHRAGSFAKAYDELVYIHERMAENGTHFAASLQQMHDDLVDLAASSERSRKTWKTSGLAAEQKVVDLEQAMRKSKAKYDSLADEYERARTGEGRQTGKVLNAFKNKSAAQQEEDLLKKVQAADQSYHGHVQTLQTEKSHLESTTRPETIKAVQDLIKELDEGLTLQMQKFAAFNEKLLLSNGLSISPIKGPGGESHPASRSLRHAVMSIDNERDLREYVGAHHSKVPAKSGEIKYERNPVLNPQPAPLSQAPPPSTPQAASSSPQVSGVSAASAQSPLRSTAGGGFGSPKSPQGPPSLNQSFSATGPPEPGRPFTQPHNRSYSQGNMQQQFIPPSSGAPPYNGSRDVSSQGAPQLGALSFQSTAAPPPQQAPAPFQPPSHGRKGSAHMVIPGGVRNSPPPQAPPAPLNPVFGVTLGRLYERDGLAVPLVVEQCIQAVELFGLSVEGIYRQSGSMGHVQKLKHMFDTATTTESQSKALDFRNPENFFHDVNSVTGLLKQFLREFPDPLLTLEHHDAFIAAASECYPQSFMARTVVDRPVSEHDDDIVRRDSLHAIINSLPDPNYATLRALCLHLSRVIENAHINRMNAHNLAVIFGPTLMGTDPSKAIADAGWQIKVVDTILLNTYQIFDED
ncbi:Rho GTPase-activating protein [Amphichorda felina]